MDTRETERQAGGCPFAGAQRALLASATLTDPAIRDDPGPFYKAMRAQAPVFYDEKLGAYLVARYTDLRTVFDDHQTYSAEQGYNARMAKGYFDEFKAILERDGGGYFPDAIKSDPPRHTRIRKLMESAFSPHRVRLLEPEIEKIAADLVAKMAAKGTADGVRDFSVPMTIRVICHQLGIGDFDTDRIKRWSHAMLQQIGMVQSREQMVEHAKQICECQNFIISQIKDREQNPKEDMISDLVHAHLDGDDTPKLAFTETVSLVRALLVAGNETTTTGMSNLLFNLATRPETVKRLHAGLDNDSLLLRFVDEVLRTDPPIRVSSRSTTREVELGGVKLPKDALLLLVYGSGNGDESAFANPDAFDIDRSNLSRSLTFGAGVHRCIGASLARMEIKVAAREIVKRLDNIRLTVPVEQITFVPSVATHGIAALPMAFTSRR